MALAPSPHPRSVYLMLKQAARTYFNSGTAASIAVATITGVAASTTPLSISGTVTVALGARQPASVAIKIMQASTQRYATSALVAPVTGAFNVVVPPMTLAAGAYTAVVTSVSPTATATSNSFTMTA